VHKPTDAAFTPDPTDPYSGIMRLGHLGSSHPNGAGFKPDDVCRVMNELWVDYVASNPKLLAVGGVRKATNETLLELKLNRDAGFHPHYAWLVRQVYEGIMSSNQKGNVSIAIALVALIISLLRLYRSCPEISSSAMTAVPIDGVDATP